MTVLPGDETAVDIDVSLRSEATAVAAQNQLDEHLETCAEPWHRRARGCGIRIPWGTEFRAVSEYRYRIEKLPTLALSGNGFAGGGGRPRHHGHRNRSGRRET